MSEERVRVLDVDDYEDVLDLWQRAELHSLKPLGRDSREALTRQLQTGVMTLIGLERGDRLVGAVMATHDSRKGWINRLAVDPDHRRRGYGRRLIRAAEDALGSQDIHIIAALIESDNPASLALFRKMGYVDAGRRIHYLSKREDDQV